MEVEFDQSSCSRHCDENLIERKLGYIGKIQEIMQVNFLSFKCKWWDTFDINNVKVDHNSGLIHIKFEEMLLETKDPYSFPKHCNLTYFYPGVLDKDWWFVQRHDLRSKHIF